MTFYTTRQQTIDLIQLGTRGHIWYNSATKDTVSISKNKQSLSCKISKHQSADWILIKNETKTLRWHRSYHFRFWWATWKCAGFQMARRATLSVFVHFVIKWSPLRQISTDGCVAHDQAKLSQRVLERLAGVSLGHWFRQTERSWGERKNGWLSGWILAKCDWGCANSQIHRVLG